MRVQLLLEKYRQIHEISILEEIMTWKDRQQKELKEFLDISTKAIQNANDKVKSKVMTAIGLINSSGEDKMSSKILKEIDFIQKSISSEYNKAFSEIQDTEFFQNWMERYLDVDINGEIVADGDSLAQARQSSIKDVLTILNAKGYKDIAQPFSLFYGTNKMTNQKLTDKKQMSNYFSALASSFGEKIPVSM